MPLVPSVRLSVGRSNNGIGSLDESSTGNIFLSRILFVVVAPLRDVIKVSCHEPPPSWLQLRVLGVAHGQLRDTQRGAGHKSAATKCVTPGAAPVVVVVVVVVTAAAHRRVFFFLPSFATLKQGTLFKGTGAVGTSAVKVTRELLPVIIGPTPFAECHRGRRSKQWKKKLLKSFLQP